MNVWIGSYKLTMSIIRLRGILTLWIQSMDSVENLECTLNPIDTGIFFDTCVPGGGEKTPP